MNWENQTRRIGACLLWICVIAVPISSTHSEEFGAWVISRNIDRFSDKEEPTFELRARSVSPPPQLENLKVSILLLCPWVDFKNGRPPFRFTTGIITFNPKITLFKTSFEYRFDSQKSERYYDPNLHDSVLLGNVGFKDFVAKLSKSKKLIIRVFSDTVGMIDAEFDLTGSEAVVKQFRSACGPIG